jgi:DNA-binding NtrC family response regulator
MPLQVPDGLVKAWLVLRDPFLHKRALALSDDLGGAPASHGLAEILGARGGPGLVVDAASARADLPRFLAWVGQPSRTQAVLFLAGADDISLASAVIEAGAEFYLRLPVSDAELKAVLGQLCRLSARRLGSDGPGDTVLLESPQMQAVYSRIRTIAPLDALNVLIAGETGTGKQEAARLLHHHSSRWEGPFAEVDCAALPPTLVESELFGHEAGAFTDARSRQSGLFEVAQRGTLFLDEVGELPLEVQAKLLRALELRRFRRVGGREELQLDLRLVSASNRDLGEEVRAGRFRADLYYRLNGVGLRLPPLRERLEDLEALTAFFYARSGTLFGRQLLPLKAEILAVLREHSWPGNIRELKSLVQRLTALTPHGHPVSAELTRQELQPHRAVAPEHGGNASHVPSLREAEEALVRRALVACGGNKTAAARLIGVSKPTYFRMLKQYGIKA